MNLAEFRKTLSDDMPPAGISPLLEALWYMANDNWEEAHEIAQAKEGVKEYDLLHAYLHRVEGDEWNAGYWYRRAGAGFPSVSTDDEWQQLANRWL